jgi:hypothetical protein
MIFLRLNFCFTSYLKGQYRIHFGLNVHIELAEIRLSLVASSLDVQSMNDGEQILVLFCSSLSLSPVQPGKLPAVVAEPQV